MEDRPFATDKIVFKNRLKAYCQQAIEQRIAFTRQLMEDAQAAANSEEKSSAGDKYETSRAMSHLDKDMHARQLSAHLQELSFVRAIHSDTVYATAVAGACIVCEEVLFFLATGLGKQPVENSAVIFVSPLAPLAKMLIGKKIADTIFFAGRKMVITDLY